MGGKLSGWFRSLPLTFQYLAFILLFILVSLAVTGRVARQPVEAHRGQMVLLIAQLAHLEGGLMPRLNEVLEGLGIDAWVVDETGTPLFASTARPLPLDWELVERPAEEFEVRWSSRMHTFRNMLAVTRLVSHPPRYLVAHFSSRFEGGKMVSRILLWFTFWPVVGSLVVLVLLIPGAMKRRREGGFTLVSLLIALGILGLAMVAFQRLLYQGVRSNRHVDLRMAVRALSDTIRERVDCARTFADVDVNKDCGANPKPILLRDRNGQPLTEPLESVTGTFDPLDSTFQGAGRLGSWYLRAYCENGGQNLVIRYARRLGEARFSADPFTGRPYDWQTSTTNPLFGTADRRLCGTRASKPYGLLGARMFYRHLTTFADLRVDNVPSNTKVVKLTMSAVNLRSYGKDDVLSEDTGFLTVLANLSASTSTGYFGVIGGTGPANVALFGWEDESFSGVNRVQGWTNPSHPEALAASTFRPQFRYDPGRATFVLTSLPKYAPAAYVFLVEFYGD